MLAPKINKGDRNGNGPPEDVGLHCILSLENYQTYNVNFDSYSGDVESGLANDPDLDQHHSYFKHTLDHFSDG